jgi:membrane protein
MTGPVSRISNYALLQPLKALPRVFRQASSEWINDNAPRLGAAVAFYTLLSLAPTIVIAVAAAAAVYGQQATKGWLASEILGVVGPEAARTIQEITRGAYKPGTGVIATVLGLVILAFAASSAFVELHDAMNAIWNVPLPRARTKAATVIHLIKDRFYSFATVMGAGFLLLVSVGWNAWIAAMGIAVPQAATFMLSVLVIAVLFAALYKTLPDLKVNWSDVALGAIITSLLFTIGKQLMGLYFAHTSFASTYGAAGLPLVVLLWVYYSAQIFFWGAEFTKVYARTMGSRRGRRHSGQ